MVQPAHKRWGAGRRTHAPQLKNAKAPAPVLVGYLAAALGLALRDLRLHHDITPWRSSSIDETGPFFNPFA